MLTVDHPKQVGKYELEEFLGGGMSHVYRARDSVLGRRVAVKILTADAMSDVEAKARFLQEARMASNMRHENIISIYDFGEDQGLPFMVMEYVEGETLRNAIKQGATGDYHHRLRLALQAARALEYIHSRKIVHRDVKPENMHVDKLDKLRLMDFGIAKADGVNMGKPGVAIGTPFYMSPEQVLGRQPTLQADVYSFGVMLYELLTGEKIITATSMEEIFHQILHNQPNPEPLQRAEVSSEVCGLIAKCTSKQLIQRPANMTVVCSELEKILATAPAQRPAPQQVAVTPGLLSPSSQRPESIVELKMPPPPEVQVVPEASGSKGLGDLLRSPVGLMAFTAVAVIVCVFVIFQALEFVGLL